MLQDKASELPAAKRRKLLERLASDVGRMGHDLYYAPTSHVATFLLKYAREDAGLNADELALLDGLKRRDVEMILSIRT